jgi:hypothetical protein
MNRRTKTLLVLPAAAGVAALGWATTANSAPPDFYSGRFSLTPSASSINVTCPAPNSPAGTTDTPLQFSVSGGGNPAPPAGQILPFTSWAIGAYQVNGGPLGPITFGVNSTGLYGAGTTVQCPETLGTSTSVSFTANAGAMIPYICLPYIGCFGGGFKNFGLSPATANVTLNFNAASSGANL